MKKEDKKEVKMSKIERRNQVWEQRKNKKKENKMIQKNKKKSQKLI